MRKRKKSWMQLKKKAKIELIGKGSITKETTLVARELERISKKHKISLMYARNIEGGIENGFVGINDLRTLASFRHALDVVISKCLDEHMNNFCTKCNMKDECNRKKSKRMGM